jgi:hypothetical protein
LSAYRDIAVSDGITISNTGSGNLTLRADNASIGSGTISFGTSGHIDLSGSTGHVSLLYNPTAYSSPTEYSSYISTNGSWIAPTDGSVSSQATAYMLVNNVTNLQNVSTNLASTYALGTDIDASSVVNFAPIATDYSSQFSGIFDGQGHTISNLTINDTTDAYVGLFGLSRGIIRNLSLTGESVTGYQVAGGLVGDNYGTVANVASAGTMSATFQAARVGGLLGANENGGLVENSSSSAVLNLTGTNFQGSVGGLIGYSFNSSVSKSYATGAVTVTSSGQFSNPQVGGLIGYSDYGNSITSSYATGAVNVNIGATSLYTPLAGGLVGGNFYSTIQDSYATGAVTGGAYVYTGGLAGSSDGNSTISSSYAIGPVSAATTNRGGGLMGSSNGFSVTCSYWDTQATGQSGASGNSATISGATGQITSALQSGTLPSGFSSSTWFAPTGAYPFLAWTGKVISGTVFNGGSVLASTTVAGLANGINIGTATTNGSGFYTFVAPASDFNGASGVLTYLTGAAKGNTFSDGDGSGAYTGMNIYAGTLQLMNRTNNTYSGMLASLNSALGSNSGANFLFSPNSGNITLNSGTNLSITSQLAFNLDRTISTSGTVAIQSQGTVDQSKPITAGVLSLTGAGDFSLGQANNIETLAANTGGYLAVDNIGDLKIGAAGGVTSITSGGTVWINTITGSLTVDHGATVTANGPGDALQLSTGNAFLNESSGALNVASGGGRWLVFSNNPANDTRGDLAYDFKQYNYNAAVDNPAQSAGNGFIYTYVPTVSAHLTGNLSKTYDGTTSAALSASNFTTTGGIDGDTIVLNAPSRGTYANPNVNIGIGVAATGIALASASNGVIPVYGYQLVNSSAAANIGAITPATLTYTAASASRPAGTDNPAFTGLVTGFVNNETLATATSGTALFTSPADAASAAGRYAIDGSGLTANHGNYVLMQAAGNTSALTVTAVSAPPPVPTPTPTPSPTPPPTPGPSVLTVIVNNTTRLQNQSNPTFTATYSSSDGSSILAGLTFQTTASASSPAGIYQITASAPALSGYTINIVPGTLTVLNNTPQTIPSQVVNTSPVLPFILPAPANTVVNFLQPGNALGAFQITFDSNFAGFDIQQTPLAQSSSLSDGSKPSTYFAGAKP